MYGDGPETADCTSNEHAVEFLSALTTMDLNVFCKVTEELSTEQRQIGSWIATDYRCPHCGEIFRIINPDPVNQDLS